MTESHTIEAGDTDTDAGTDTDAIEERRRRSALVRLAVLGGLVVLLLASGLYLGGRVLDPASGSPSAGKLVRTLTGGHDAGRTLAGERDAAMSRASEFTTVLNSFGPADLGPDGKTMPGYRDAVGELVTSKLRSEFLKDGVPLAEATVAQQGAGRSSQVYAAGVAAIDEDTATVLVAGQVKYSFPKTPSSKKRVVVDRQLYRYQVSMVKSDGEWQVDSYAPAAQPPAQAATGSAGSAGSLPGDSAPGGAR